MGRKVTGHVRERNGSWVVEVAGEHIGSYADEKKAERIKRAAVREREGEAPDAFSEFGAEWMDMRELDARRRKRMSAFDKERSRWNAHIVGSSLWNLSVRHMKPKLIQKWIGAMFKKEAVQIIRSGTTGVIRKPTGELIGRATIAQALKLLKLCLDAAVIDGKLKENPARLARMPREEPREHDGELIIHCSLAEIAALFALELPAMQRAVFAVAIYCGLREDELWGLRWMDVRLDGARPEIQVRRSYDGPVKTKYALRDVPILPPAVAALRAWRSLTRSGSAAIELAGLVFPGAEGKCHGESYTAGWRGKARRRTGELVVVDGWRAKAGIRAEVDFKDLRHTCGCHLAQGSWTAEMPLGKIKKWLGHSTILVTERHYAAFTSDNLHVAALAHRFKP